MSCTRFSQALARTSTNHVRETTDGSPHANTVRGHFTDQFDLDTAEAVGNTLLSRDVFETLPDQPVEVVVNLHLDPYGGEADETESLYFSQVVLDAYARVRS